MGLPASRFLGYEGQPPSHERLDIDKNPKLGRAAPERGQNSTAHSHKLESPNPRGTDLSEFTFNII